MKAGKPVEFLFENIDLMPHNFVITQPGALEEIGLAGRGVGHRARCRGPQLRAEVEQGAAVAAACSSRASRRSSASPRRRSRASIPIVCTYPGHWRRMYGALYVVDDLDEYLANPEGYLAKHPLPMRRTRC